MASPMMKAVAAAAAVGALAAGADDVMLVQCAVRGHSFDATQLNETFTSAFASLLGAMELEGNVRVMLGDVNPGFGAQCTAADMKSMSSKLGNLMMKVSDTSSPMATVTQVVKELEDCKSVTFGGMPDVAAFSPCMGSFFGVSKPCSDCGRNYFEGMTELLGGCMSKCVPMMVACRNAQSEGPTGNCVQSSAACMKCGQPHWKEYSKCVVGSPNTDETFRVMDQVFDAVARGSLSTGDALQEFANAAMQRLWKLGAARRAELASSEASKEE